MGEAKGTTDATEKDQDGPSEAPEDDEQRASDAEEEGPDAGGRRASFRGRLGDGLFNSLLDSGSAIKRGQDIVTGLAGGTKEEIVRIVGSEVRGFLDKMDIVDLAQEVVSGLVIDVNAQIRFRRDAEGKLQPDVSKRKTSLRSGGIVVGISSSSPSDSAVASSSLDPSSSASSRSSASLRTRALITLATSEPSLSPNPVMTARRSKFIGVEESDTPGPHEPEVRSIRAVSTAHYQN
jgi:hypothetical protein